MKQFLHKVFSIGMTLLLMASTVSWSVGQHYCMGRLMNVSLFEHADDCGMMMNSGDESAYTEIKNSCCSDKVVVIEGQDDLKLSLEEISLDEQQFLIAFTLSYVDLVPNFEDQKNPFSHYLPPKLVKDIQVLDAVFLI